MYNSKYLRAAAHPVMKKCWIKMKAWQIHYIIYYQMQTVRRLNWGFFQFFRIQRFQVLKVFKCEMMHRSRSNNHQRSHNHFCQCLFSHRLEPPSDRQPPRSRLHEENIHFLCCFFFKSACVCAPVISQPSDGCHSASASPVLQHRDAAGRDWCCTTSAQTSC